jgi:negative regulator of sigma E activity
MSMHWTERLSEYHDGELSPAEYAECAAHLAECAECRDVLQELHLVTVAARADRDRQPAANLWPGILAQIENAGSAQAEPYIATTSAEPSVAPLRSEMWGRASGRPTRRQITFSLPQLALAASLLMAVTASVSYLAVQRSTPGTIAQSPTPHEVPIQAMAEPSETPPGDVQRANFANAQYDRAVADLEGMLRDQRDRLDPRTVVVIERNLTVIDDAIRQAQAALDADPANTFLNSHLADARRRKIELLRRATSIAGD